MSIFKCKMCGGTIEFEPGATVGVCDSCGTKQTLPRLDTDRKSNLYDRANHFRRNNDFDKAMGIYEQILNEDNTDAEAYWSLVLCRYGIEYVEDPASHKRIPTVNRAQYTSIYMDEDYKSALQYADVYQRQVYEEEAKAIDDIQKGILEISNKEEPFDVFICYKETDNNGRRTQDSVLANDLYHQLTQEGFKVFFARITLEDKLGTAYEPYIFAALNSSKVMVVLGTKPEYFNAVWVKNEWSRYLALVKQSGGKKVLIPAYRDMDPYDLPEEFSHLQAQDMSKLGFMQDLIRGIKKITGADQPQAITQETAAAAPVYASNVQALLKRGKMALEDKEWDKADGFFEEVLNQDAECSEAYMGKLLVANKRSSEEELFQYYADSTAKAEGSETLEACLAEDEHIQRMADEYAVVGFLKGSDIINQYDFDRTYVSTASWREYQKTDELDTLSHNRLLSRAMQYAVGSEKKRLDDRMAKLVQVMDDRIKDAQKEDEASVKRIIEVYKKHIEDVDKKVIELNQEATEHREERYQDLVSQLEAASKKGDFVLLKEKFAKLYGYKDSVALEEKCKEEIERITEEEQKKVELQKQAEEKTAKKQRRIIVAVVSVVLACIMITILIIKVIIPESKYNAAMKLYDAKKWEEAYTAFEEINYKDSEEKASDCMYNLGLDYCNAGNWEEAYTVFNSLNYKDSADKAVGCGYNLALSYYNAEKWQEAKQIFEALNYKDSADKALDCRYNIAISLVNEGKVIEGYESLIALDGYKDSEKKAEEIRAKYVAEKIKNAQVGDYIVFGSYEQDNNTSNGKEDIEWLVLAKEGSKILVVSRYALDYKPYHSSNTDVTWETCSLRTWLNGTFMNAAFDSEEKKLILSTTVTADKNPKYFDTDPGKNTTDKVFLLSITEVNKYFKSDSARQCKGTAYCYAQSADDAKTGFCWWWLRSPGNGRDSAALVSSDGDVGKGGLDVDYSGIAVRPALWINPEP